MKFPFPQLSKNKKKLIRKLQTKKGRKKNGFFLGEGVRFIETAWEGGYHFEFACVASDFHRDQELVEKLNKEGIDIYQTDPDDFQKLVPTASPQGILAVFSQKTSSLEAMIDYHPRLIIALDGIRDGGNLGTIFRTAWALGIPYLILSKDTVDLYNPKVIRASMGGIFALNIFPSGDLLASLEKLKDLGYDIVGTLPEGGKAPEDYDPQAPSVIVFGSEAQGMSQEVENLATSHITIPLQSQAESLNVSTASSIIMYHLLRKTGLL